MATDVEQLRALLTGDIRRYEASMNNAMRATNRAAAGIERRFQQTQPNIARSMAAVGRTVTTAFAGIATALAVREVIQAGDAWTQFGNQLRSVATDVGRPVASLDELVDVAMETRTALGATVELYTRMERAGSRLGRTQEDMVRITRIINQAFLAGGASASEQASAITQLSQAMAAGALQGDELRSIRENAPLLAQAIADAMGVSVGALRDLGAEGAITADIMMRAFEMAEGRISAQTESMVLTVEQAMTNLRTAALQAVGGADTAAGGTSRLAEAIDDVAQTIQDNREGIEDFFQMMVTGAQAAVTAVARLADFFSLSSQEAADGIQSVANAIELGQLTGRREIASHLRGTMNGEEFGAAQRRLNQLFETDYLYSDPSRLDTRGTQQLVEYLHEIAARYRDAAEARREFADENGDGARTPSGSGAGSGSLLPARPETDEARRARQARDRLELTRQIEIAEAQGDQKRQQALQSQLDLYNRTIEYQEAGLAMAREQAIVDQAIVDAAAEVERHKENYLEQQERAVELAEAQLQHELAIAQALGDDARVRQLERELSVRERIAELTGSGTDPEKAAAIANREADALMLAERQGEFRETFRRTFSDGILAALQRDEEVFARWVRDGATRGLEQALNRLADQLFDLFSQIGQNGKGGGGLLGGVGGWLANLITGGRGGPPAIGKSPVSANSPAVTSALPPAFNVPVPVAAAPASSPIIVNEFHLHAEGAVMTDELMNEFQAKVDESRFQTLTTVQGAAAKQAKSAPYKLR
jgi:tape measure domain-containing protein